LIVDVGGEFDLKRNRYDHHQRDFNLTFSDKHTIKLSSAGLTYKFHGKEVIRNILKKGDEERKENNEWTENQIDTIYNHVYCNFIEGIDATDNGVPQYDSELPPNYRIGTDLGSRVSRLNVNWNEENDKTKEMNRFIMAMELVEQELVYFVRDCAYSWLPARDLVEEAVKNRLKLHPSGMIIEVSQFCPWTDHFFEIEQNQDIKSTILFLIFPESNSKTTTYRVRAVPTHPKSFDLRKGLKPEWRGVSDNEIETVSGINGVMFVHPNGFIGGNKTKEGALQMAVESL